MSRCSSSFGSPALGRALVLACCAGLLPVGCSTTKPADEAGAGGAGGAGYGGSAYGSGGASTAGLDGAYGDRYGDAPWNDPASPLYQRVIYFDYDTAEIRPEYVAVMRTHARYLGSNAGTKATLEGHTDERGTREYNLALGDQRAESVRRFMIADGVRPEQLATLSYGEERPAEAGQGETSWGKNRRVVIQY